MTIIRLVTFTNFLVSNIHHFGILFSSPFSSAVSLPSHRSASQHPSPCLLSFRFSIVIVIIIVIIVIIIVIIIIINNINIIIIILHLVGLSTETS